MRCSVLRECRRQPEWSGSAVRQVGSGRGGRTGRTQQNARQHETVKSEEKQPHGTNSTEQRSDVPELCSSLFPCGSRSAAAVLCGTLMQSLYLRLPRVCGVCLIRCRSPADTCVCNDCRDQSPVEQANCHHRFSCSAEPLLLAHSTCLRCLTVRQGSLCEWLAREVSPSCNTALQES